MKKRILSILLTLALLLPSGFTVGIGGLSASASGADAVETAVKNTAVFSAASAAIARTGIDYTGSTADIIIRGKIDGAENSAYSVNLSKETLTVPGGYNIAAYSINGGTSWIAVTASRPFTDAVLSGLFSQNTTLALTDRYEAGRRRVPSGAVIVTFPRINRRPALRALDINYRLGADTTGKTAGTWLLTEQGVRVSVKEGLEIGVIGADGRLDEFGYGRFTGRNGSVNGIAVLPLPEDGKPVSTPYFVRSAATAGGDGTYTAASAARRINVSSQRAAPNNRVSRSRQLIEYAAYTYIMRGGSIELKSSAGEFDVSGFTGDVYLWGSESTASPATAMQKISFTAETAAAAFAFESSSVTAVPEAAFSAQPAAPPANIPAAPPASAATPTSTPSSGGYSASSTPTSTGTGSSGGYTSMATPTSVRFDSPLYEIRVGHGALQVTLRFDSEVNFSQLGLDWEMTPPLRLEVIETITGGAMIGSALVARIIVSGTTPDTINVTLRATVAGVALPPATTVINILSATDPLPPFEWVDPTPPDDFTLEAIRNGATVSRTFRTSFDATIGNVVYTANEVGTVGTMTSLPPGMLFDNGALTVIPTNEGRWSIQVFATYTYTNDAGTLVELRLVRVINVTVYGFRNISFGIGTGETSHLRAMEGPTNILLTPETGIAHGPPQNHQLQTNRYIDFTALPAAGYRVRRWVLYNTVGNVGGVGVIEKTPTAVMGSDNQVVTSNTLRLDGNDPRLNPTDDWVENTMILVEFERIPPTITTATLPVRRVEETMASIPIAGTGVGNRWYLVDTEGWSGTVGATATSLDIPITNKYTNVTINLRVSIHEITGELSLSVPTRVSGQFINQLIQGEGGQWPVTVGVHNADPASSASQNPVQPPFMERQFTLTIQDIYNVNIAINYVDQISRLGSLRVTGALLDNQISPFTLAQNSPPGLVEDRSGILHLINPLRVREGEQLTFLAIEGEPEIDVSWTGTKVPPGIFDSVGNTFTIHIDDDIGIVVKFARPRNADVRYYVADEEGVRDTSRGSISVTGGTSLGAARRLVPARASAVFTANPNDAYVVEWWRSWNLDDINFTTIDTGSPTAIPPIPPSVASVGNATGLWYNYDDVRNTWRTASPTAMYEWTDSRIAWTDLSWEDFAQLLKDDLLPYRTLGQVQNPLTYTASGPLSGNVVLVVILRQYAATTVESVEIYAPPLRSPHNIGIRGNETQRARILPTNYPNQNIVWSLDFIDTSAVPPVPLTDGAAKYNELMSGVTDPPAVPAGRWYEVLMPEDSGYEFNVLKYRLAASPTSTGTILPAGTPVSVARVESSGKVEVLPTARIGMRFDVVATSLADNSKWDSRRIIVSQYVPVSGINIIDSKTEMITGDTYTFVASVAPDLDPPLGASNKDVVWSVVSGNSVTVDPNTGLVTAVREGTTVLRVTTVGTNSAGNTLSTTTTVRVVQPKIEIDPISITFPAARPGYSPRTPVTVMVTNTGEIATGTLTLTVTEGANAFDLSVDSLASIATGDFRTFTVVPKTGLAAGQYHGIVTITGAGGIRVTLPLTFIVDATAPFEEGPPGNIRPNPPPGTTGVVYTHTFVADGEPILSWVASGLPPGLTLSNSGVLSGTPTQAGSYPITIRAWNSIGETEGQFTIIISVGLTILGPPAPSGWVGVSYSHQYTAEGAQPITWSIESGSLPPGLTLSSTTGRITGIPTRAGQYNYVVRATNNPTDLYPDSITILTQPAFPVILLPNEWSNNQGDPTQLPGGSMPQAHLPNATIGTRYNNTLLTRGFEDTNGVFPPLYWQIIGGTLPPGLRLTQWVDGVTQPNTAAASDTGAARAGAVIEGTPAAGGAGLLYTVIVEASELVYYQRGTTVVWRRSGFNLADASANPNDFERINWGANNIVVFDRNRRATRTINIFVRAQAHYETAGLRLNAAGIRVVTNSDVNFTSTLSIPDGTTTTITHQVLPQNATIKEVIFESSNPAAATVSQGGAVRAVAPGTTRITATTIDGLFSATCDVTVTAVAVAGITFTANRMRIGVTGTANLTAAIRPDNATNKELTWTTSDAGIVEVDSTGRITGIRAGTATITARSNNNISANVTVVVDPLAVTGVSFARSSMTINVGLSETLIATVMPVNASNTDVVWSSSNTTVATVGANTGRITGIAAGTAVITATSVDGNYTADIQITVVRAFNITLVQQAGGTVSASRTRAAEGERVTLTAAPVAGYYLAGWETTPATVAVAANSFSMPDRDISVQPVFVKYTFLTDPLPADLDTSKASYTYKLTPESGSVGVSVSGKDLVELTTKNPGFTIDLETSYGIYRFPVNISSLIPDMQGILSRSSVSISDVMFNLKMTDKSGDAALLEAADTFDMRVMGSAAEFVVEISTLDSQGSAGRRIAEISNFTDKISRLIPLVPNVRPDGQWGAFRYNGTANQFEFVPHTVMLHDGQWYAIVRSNTNGMYAVAQNPVNFSDVPNNQWYTPFIREAAGKNLVRGMGGGLYQPERNVTRAEFVQMMANALQLPGAAADTRTYSDVIPTDWHHNAIMRAMTAGLLSDDRFSGVNFNPNQPITREEMAIILAAALRLHGLAYVSTGNFTRDFTDHGSVRSANLRDAALVYHHGIMQGMPGGVFSPGGRTTRAQAATVQIRLLKTLGFID
ncbi:MAG: Ig-like domain-containing protein [Oscillospiraceae bacterium]|nr:Ig-like domain-containing protein [Oscillospiraceae bacterium]